MKPRREAGCEVQAAEAGPAKQSGALSAILYLARSRGSLPNVTSEERSDLSVAHISPLTSLADKGSQRSLKSCNDRASERDELRITLWKRLGAGSQSAKDEPHIFQAPAAVLWKGEATCPIAL